MKVIIMGCGRVGEQVSRVLADEGHDVTVIDKEERALARLGPQFKGKRIKGVGFDREVLIQAGIESADAFAAASSSDNANIIAARIARNIFRVPRVVTRLYDPRRAEIYHRLGLVTISATAWGAERIRELLTHADFDPVLSFGRGEVSLVGLEAPSSFAGRLVKHFNVPGEISVVAVVRDGMALLPNLGTELRAGDTIYLAVLALAMDRLQSLLD
ncbi:MAG: TrkA family potassium uptake protein [Chloroflexi bacterium]|nr:TrkA family potassium uptake protein [Chloroflexota bacterium]MCI0645717.1 TrkA family potassium uptake protein [Chloroflexota bacterium]MCI0730122.1 TrkA family potassium uptake protein [Chloroflexota bacterium]